MLVARLHERAEPVAAAEGEVSMGKQQGSEGHVTDQRDESGSTHDAKADAHEESDDAQQAAQQAGSTCKQS